MSCIVNEFENPTVVEKMGYKNYKVTNLTLEGYVTSSIRLRDHLIRHRQFPIGGHLEPNCYLYRFSRFDTSSTLRNMLNCRCACAIWR